MSDGQKYAYIYGLKDPRDGRIYYVGKSDNPKRRKKEHLKDKTCNASRVAWINELQRLRLEPEMVMLSEVLQEDWRDTERYWIARGYEEGWPLVNIVYGEGGAVVPKANYEFMRSYIRPDLWGAFDGLSIRQKDEICLKAGRAMAALTLPILEYKISLHKYGTNQRVMWSIVDDESVWAAAQVATAEVERRMDAEHTT